MTREAAYEALHRLTEPICASCTHLGRPYGCCEPAACEQAAADAFKQGVLLVPPFISEHGCLLPPHLRPMCTRYTCKGTWKGEKIDGYDRLVEEIDKCQR